MHTNASGSKSTLSRCVSAEVRARMAARRLSGKSLAAMVGMSQNYLATRLRDEKPFSLDDLDALLVHLDEGRDAWEFMRAAQDNHSDRVSEETMLAAVSQADYMLAARDANDDAEAEAQTEEP